MTQQTGKDPTYLRQLAEERRQKLKKETRLSLALDQAAAEIERLDRAHGETVSPPRLHKQEG